MSDFDVFPSYPLCFLQVVLYLFAICFLNSHMFFQMPDRFAADARYALIRSWNSPYGIPRSYFSSSTFSWQTRNAYGDWVVMRRVGAITQTEGHFVPCFGCTIRSNVPSFGVLNIHLQSLDFPSETVYAHPVSIFSFLSCIRCMLTSFCILLGRVCLI